MRTTSLSIAVALSLLSGCAAGPQASGSGPRGVGTPGVLAYRAADGVTTVPQLVAACSRARAGGVSSETDRGFAAACAQLRRTMHNQPGNAAGPSG